MLFALAPDFFASTYQSSSLADYYRPIAHQCRSNRHLYMMKVSDDESCQLCQEKEESSQNFLVKCIVNVNRPGLPGRDSKGAFPQILENVFRL